VDSSEQPVPKRKKDPEIPVEMLRFDRMVDAMESVVDEYPAQLTHVERRR
jgi:hypothetical protein